MRAGVAWCGFFVDLRYFNLVRYMTDPNMRYATGAGASGTLERVLPSSLLNECVTESRNDLKPCERAAKLARSLKVGPMS